MENNFANFQKKNKTDGLYIEKVNFLITASSRDFEVYYEFNKKILIGSSIKKLRNLLGQIWKTDVIPWEWK